MPLLILPVHGVLHMLFTRIDRYVSSGFLVRLVGALCVMGFLYVSFDVLKRLDSLQGSAAGDVVNTLGTYYARYVPLFLVELVPGLVLIAAGMVLVKMAASHELLALKASGTSLYRVVAPIFFWTLLVSVGTFVIRERMGPGSVEQVAVLKHVLDDPVAQHLLLSDDAHSRKVFVGKYDFADGTMQRVFVMDTDPATGHLTRTLRAERAHWGEAGQIVLLNVLVEDFAQEGATSPIKGSTEGEVLLETSLTSLDMVEAAEEDTDSPASFQSLSELRRYSRLYPGVAYFRVAYHSRLASFFNPLVLLLVGIPCLVGFERSVNSRFVGILLGIVLAGALYALTFVFTSMAKTGTLDPVAACWLPQIAGGATGLWLFESMLT